ncbi:MAG: radical SAM protein [Nanoarchaeota archaeon]|nr:radical SAM protein [Nanoarchaeota archaeon]MBU1322184.1 radical SAM protein [Nanoarchaeota archaeon]MBU1597725.1 radical SAM protein [Nanoarchaeota archaeon]MBU2442107.1 radical SAM protein [Nanoarchaeota archaeon]
MSLVDILRKKKLKLSAGLEITNLCNLNCVYCYQDKTKQYELSANEWIKVVEFLNTIFQHDLIDYKFSGGEVFTKKGISQAIKTALDTTANVTVVTNGVSIPIEFMSLVNKSNLHIEVSLDGEKDIHDKFRGSFDNTISNIKKMCDLEADIAIRTSVYKENSLELYDFIAYMKGISQNFTFNFQPIFSMRNPLEATPLSLEEYFAIASKIKQSVEVKQKWRIYDSFAFSRDYRQISKTASEIFGCEVGASVVIKPNGSYSPCEFHISKSNILGSSKEDFLHSLEDSLIPNSKCTVCEVLEECGGCRLAPMKHNYTFTFGFKSCKDYIKRLGELR